MNIITVSKHAVTNTTPSRFAIKDDDKRPFYVPFDYSANDPMQAAADVYARHMGDILKKDCACIPVGMRYLNSARRWTQQYNIVIVE